MSNQNSPVKILRIKDVIALTGLCRSSIYNKINPRSPYYDQNFPKSFKLGLRTTGWLNADIENWLTALKENQHGKYEMEAGVCLSEATKQILHDGGNGSRFVHAPTEYPEALQPKWQLLRNRSK
jgi:prophage regulatory protein